MNYIKDVPLYNDDGTVNLIIEICPGTSDKTELTPPNNESLTCVRQVEGVYPFYYGSFPRTHAGDNDPLDFILFTDIKHCKLDLVRADVVGAIKTIDAGEVDDKIICVETSSGITNIKKSLKEALKFLSFYKGLNADMVVEKKLANRAEAEDLVATAYLNWKNKNSISTTNNVSQKSKLNRYSNNNTRIKIIKR